MWLLPSVGSHVRLEMIGPGELSLAHFTLERADTRVLAAVSTELVRSGEPLATPLMVTHIWLLSGVLSDVHLQVGELEVAFGAARVEADKWLPLLVNLWLWRSNEAGGLLVHALGHLRQDEGRVSRHCHLDWSCSLVEVCV